MSQEPFLKFLEDACLGHIIFVERKNDMVSEAFGEKSTCLNWNWSSTDKPALLFTYWERAKAYWNGIVPSFKCFETIIAIRCSKPSFNYLSSMTVRSDLLRHDSSKRIIFIQSSL